jgi:hypothetical protein
VTIRLVFRSKAIWRLVQRASPMTYVIEYTRAV